MSEKVSIATKELVKKYSQLTMEKKAPIALPAPCDGRCGSMLFATPVPAKSLLRSDTSMTASDSDSEEVAWEFTDSDIDWK